MLYILSGDDEVFKNEIINKIKKNFISYDYQFFYIESENEFKQILENSIMFLSTFSFLNKNKLLKLNCKSDSYINKILDKLLPLCDDNNITVINVELLKESLVKKIKLHKNVIYLNSNNFKNKNDALKYISKFLNSNNIIFKSYEDSELFLNLLLCSSKITNSKSYDKQEINLGLNTLLNTYDYLEKPLKFENVKNLYFKKFDGDFFILVDTLFRQNSMLDLITFLDNYIEVMNSEDICNFLRIFIYNLKEYIKFDNNMKTKKYYLFKNNKTKIINVELFLCELDDLSFNTRIYKKFNVEKFYFLLIKHVKYI